jgi:hypothetical protein
MLRISLALVALALMTLAGCGDRSPGASEAPAIPVTGTSPAAPPASPTDVSVTRDRAGPDYRAHGRTWRDCGTTVYESGDDLYGIAVSGPLDCEAGTNVMKALARQVQRRGSATGKDCFPGYCYAGDPRPTTVAGYRCDATDHGDVSISLDIVCRRGDRYVTAGAADDE